MAEAFLEHVNITVRDADKTAKKLCNLFDWKIRWQGDAIYGGRTVHVGGTDSYIAVYTPAVDMDVPANSYQTRAALNHIAVVVDDLDAVEKRVKKAGYDCYNHADYEPGRRFYYRDEDEVEYEIVSY